MRNLALMCVLAACLLGCGDSDSDGLTWYCGTEDKPRAVKATLKDGTLTVSGTGEMREYGIPFMVLYDSNGTKTTISYSNRPQWRGIKSSISGVVIEDGVTRIGRGAFYECTNLTSVTIGKDVTEIDSWAFVDCISLTSVTIPNNVIKIGSNAFSGCTGLMSVTLGNGLTEIDDWAFDGCTGLTSVTIPNSVTEIEMQVFKGCTGLTSVTIPNSVTEIEMGAFEGCTSLMSVTIPNSVTKIERKVFKGCKNLTSINVQNPAPPELGSETFEQIDSNACLYVPKGSIDAYHKANEWNDFKCIKPIASAPE